MSRRHSRDLRRERYNQNRESALAPNRNMATNVNLTQAQYQALIDRITALEGQPTSATSTTNATSTTSASSCATSPTTTSIRIQPLSGRY